MTVGDRDRVMAWICAWLHGGWTLRASSGLDKTAFSGEWERVEQCHLDQLQTCMDSEKTGRYTRLCVDASHTTASDKSLVC
eukprot:48035-Eustigmatos_ZCMA.PRE.1